jgi:hypothetical protein
MANWRNYRFHLHKIAEVPVHRHEGSTHEDEHRAVAEAKKVADARLAEAKDMADSKIAETAKTVEVGRKADRKAVDRRLLILYILIIVVFASVLGIVRNDQQESDRERIAFENAIVMNCEANQENTENFNDLIDRLLETYQASTVLTPEERQQRIDFFTPAKGEVPKCPPQILDE